MVRFPAASICHIDSCRTGSRPGSGPVAWPSSGVFLNSCLRRPRPFEPKRDVAAASTSPKTLASSLGHAASQTALRGHQPLPLEEAQHVAYYVATSTRHEDHPRPAQQHASTSPRTPGRYTRRKAKMVSRGRQASLSAWPSPTSMNADTPRAQSSQRHGQRKSSQRRQTVKKHTQPNTARTS